MYIKMSYDNFAIKIKLDIKIMYSQKVKKYSFLSNVITSRCSKNNYHVNNSTDYYKIQSVRNIYKKYK